MVTVLKEYYRILTPVPDVPQFRHTQWLLNRLLEYMLYNYRIDYSTFRIGKGRLSQQFG